MTLLRCPVIEIFIGRRSFYRLFVLLAMFLCSGLSAQEGSLFGKIEDGQDGSSLTGANAALINAATGERFGITAAGLDGTYRFENIPSGNFRLVVRFIGYESRSISIRFLPAENKEFDIRLKRSGFDANRVTGASEDVLNKGGSAAQSIDALKQAALLGNLEPAAIEHLPGVFGGRLSQVHSELAARGFLRPFMPGLAEKVNNRATSTPGFESKMYSSIPVGVQALQSASFIASEASDARYADGSLLFSKRDPLTSPGVTLMLGGGSAQSRQLGLRSTNVYARQRVAWTMAASYVQAEEWRLNSSDSLDAVVLQSDSVSRQEQARRLHVEGDLAFRLGRRSWLRAWTGLQQTKATLPTPMGIAQLEGVRSFDAGLKLTVGRFSLVASADQLNTGDSFFYNGNLWKDTLLRLQSRMIYDYSGTSNRFRMSVAAQQTRAEEDSAAQFGGAAIDGYSIFNGSLNIGRVLPGRFAELGAGVKLEGTSEENTLLVSPTLELRIRFGAKHLLKVRAARENNAATMHQLFSRGEMFGFAAVQDSSDTSEEYETAELTYSGLWIDKLLVTFGGYLRKYNALTLPFARSGIGTAIPAQYYQIEDLSYSGLEGDIRLLIRENITLDIYAQQRSEVQFTTSTIFADNAVVFANVPSFKVGASLNAFVEKGITLHISGHYQDEVTYNYAAQNGLLDASFILNTAVGYDLSDYAKGLRVDLSATNLLNNPVRSAVGVGAARRYALIRFTLSI